MKFNELDLDGQYNAFMAHLAESKLNVDDMISLLPANYFDGFNFTRKGKFLPTEEQLLDKIFQRKKHMPKQDKYSTQALIVAALILFSAHVLALFLGSL